MESTYGSGKYCRDARADKGKCLDLVQISNIMATSRDPKELADVWQGRHRVGPPMRKDYTRFVELRQRRRPANSAFPDSGAMWRSKYDMARDALAKEVSDRLWEQVKPLYVSLHAYVRRKLRDEYRCGRCPGARPHSRPSARQHVGPELGKHLRPARPHQRGQSLRPDEDPQGPQSGRA
jgi:peptidyl-dipeptidase A